MASMFGRPRASKLVESVPSFFETDAVEWTILGEDIVFARVLAGLHFQFSMDAGRALGLAVNAHVIENNFRPTDGDD